METVNGREITRSYDTLSRVVSRTTSSGGVSTWTYDAAGRRAELTLGGRRIAERRLAVDGLTIVEEVTFTWDGNTLCEQTTVTSGIPHGVMLTWERDGSQPLVQAERLMGADHELIDSRFFSIITDLVGTPQELIGEDGEIAWRTRSTVWGTTEWNKDAVAYTPLRFPGQYFDSESGLHYNRFRHYDSEAGRVLPGRPHRPGARAQPVQLSP
ncbi:RHS repeat domain-containing protein [Streptomyces sp. NPDC058861]|uniref:RHS repeat domain-containing protein n=1 Tax=Streptomyces sp. NPDC058861 TaxID=3346653 RepID=UPI0036B1849B